MDITPAQGQQPGPEKHASSYGDSFKRMFSGVHFQFPNYKHDHPPVIDVNKVADDQLTTGQRVADKVAGYHWDRGNLLSCKLVSWSLGNVLE